MTPYMVATALLISYWTPNMGPKRALFGSHIIVPVIWWEKRLKSFLHAPDL